MEEDQNEHVSNEELSLEIEELEQKATPCPLCDMPIELHSWWA